MSKTLADLPEVAFSGRDVMSGELPAIFARASMEHGPILRHVVQGGGYTGQQFVFLVGPDANKLVLSTHRDHFSHDLGWTPVIGDSLGHGLLNMDDPDHARHRKMWNPAFTAAYMTTYLPTMQRVIAERTAGWAERGEIDVSHEAREITFDVAAAALAGFHTGTEVNRLRELFYVLLHGFEPDDESWEQFIERMMRARDELSAMLLDLIAERRATPMAAQPHDVLDMITHARDENGEALSDAQVLAHVNILLVAGHETTTTLGAWLLYLLATQPEHSARIRAELDALREGPDGALPVDALRSARQLDYFVREAGRLYAPVINVPRGVVKDVEFNGYTIPAGTQARLAIAAGHLLPHVFADPGRFDPERFAPPREEDRRTPYALVTFGGGPRICIGINFAQIEVKALVAHVLRHYRLDVVDGQRLVRAGHWTAVLPEGMWMRVAQSRT